MKIRFQGLVTKNFPLYGIIYSINFVNNSENVLLALFNTQMHPFHTMLRKAGKRKLTEMAVSHDDLQPHKEPYTQSLHKLQSQ